MDFGEKLKALRTERGLTQEQLAARLFTICNSWHCFEGSKSCYCSG